MPKRPSPTIGSLFFPRRAPTLRLRSSSLQQMIATAEAALPNECGGILVGHREGRDIHVSSAIPVPDQNPSRGGFVRSYESAQELLDEILAEVSAASLGWVGEWHSHPKPSRPSPRDLHEISRLSREDGQPVALIVLVRDGADWNPIARVAQGGRRPLGARVVEGVE